MSAPLWIYEVLALGFACTAVHFLVLLLLLVFFDLRQRPRPKRVADSAFQGPPQWNAFWMVDFQRHERERIQRQSGGEG